MTVSTQDFSCLKQWTETVNVSAITKISYFVYIFGVLRHMWENPSYRAEKFLFLPLVEQYVLQSLCLFIPGYTW